MSRIQKIKDHVVRNKKVYITGGVCFVLGAAIGGGVVAKQQNIAIIDSFKLINWKSPHTSKTVQINIPRKGNSGNVIRDTATGTIYPSQNEVVKALGVDPSNLSRHLNGKYPDADGKIFEKLIDGASDHVLKTTES